ncbi:acetyl-CoA carboxylase carboxyl transferase subunit beta [Haloactinospora alba]|uniref:Acetyl-CoA carboxylase carboxyl transferase subunit beta n=1 Tax=Haloactinospora alba TaxID=405555 RepID=A0A543NIT6_9ACTN|nr:carboxyl transferase domain-containing protein [Haloactinospora alba]TQN31755.1 acetyl-CoA carboxylase carboxyl transferase subunit beta [Haloactinospora alba]
MSRHRSVAELLEAVLDPGSFLSWDTRPVEVHPSADYSRQLAGAREHSGRDEAVVTGEGRLRGRRVAVIACEFSFLAGSIGVAAAERLTSAVERATAEGMPLLASPSSGGTRMQEGTLAFLAMTKISAAIAAHKAAGLPYLVYLRHPTTGGVLASWGSQGHVTVAEPGALIGFLGPRVYEALYDAPFPEGVQTAENLRRRGLVDAVLAPHELPDIAERALNVLRARTERAAELVAPENHGTDTREEDDTPAWESITRSRRNGRPGVRHLLHCAATDVLPLNGTGEGETDPGLLLALARFGPAPCVLLGQDRARQTREHPLGPDALREARRGMRIARELGLPLVTVVDTPGAALSREAEEGGMAGQIARCLAELVTLEAPTVAVLLGQGTGGGALALTPADRVLCAQHAWLSPLPPEGASAVMYRSSGHAAEVAEQQGVRSAELRRNGIADRVVLEGSGATGAGEPDAADEPEEFCTRMGEALRRELTALLADDPNHRMTRRHQRYRNLGSGPG